MSKKFNYSYSTPTNKEKLEIERIRNSYLENSNNPSITTLKKLDSKVKNTPTLIAISLGMIGTLIFGTGLTLVLEFGRFIIGRTRENYTNGRRSGKDRNVVIHYIGSTFVNI